MSYPSKAYGGSHFYLFIDLYMQLIRGLTGYSGTYTRSGIASNCGGCLHLQSDRELESYAKHISASAPGSQDLQEITQAWASWNICSYSFGKVGPANSIFSRSISRYLSTWFLLWPESLAHQAHQWATCNILKLDSCRKARDTAENIVRSPCQVLYVCVSVQPTSDLHCLSVHLVIVDGRTNYLLKLPLHIIAIQRLRAVKWLLKVDAGNASKTWNTLVWSARRCIFQLQVVLCQSGPSVFTLNQCGPTIPFLWG